LESLVTPPSSPSPVTFPSDSTYITYIVDIVGRTFFEFDVPYMFQETFTVSGINDISFPSLLFPRATLFQLNTPQGGAVSVIRANFYMKAGDDFQFGRHGFTWAQNYQAIPKSGIAAQGEEVEDEIVPEGANDDSTNTLAIFGCHFSDILLLTRQPTINYSFAVAAGQPYYCLPFYGLKPAVTKALGGTTTGASAITLLQLNWTYMTYFSRLFIGMHGGVNMKLSARTKFHSSVNAVAFPPGAVVPNTIYPPIGTNATGDLTNWGICLTYDKFVHEYQVPALGTSTYVPAFRYDGSHGSVGACLSILLGIDSTVGVNMNVWMSAADDFILRGFLCVPPLYNYTD